MIGIHSLSSPLGIYPYYKIEYLYTTTSLTHRVWDITWSWFENNDKYIKEFAISENWWKASKAIEKINLLRNFNRVDEQVPHNLLRV